MRGILEVKNGPGHALYEQARTIDAAAKREGRRLTAEEEATVKALEEEMERLYEDAYEQSTRPNQAEISEGEGESE